MPIIRQILTRQEQHVPLIYDNDGVQRANHDGVCSQNNDGINNNVAVPVGGLSNVGNTGNNNTNINGVNNSRIGNLLGGAHAQARANNMVARGSANVGM